MEYVYLLQATEEQYKKIIKFLDVALKKEGLDILQDVVDIYNVAVSATKLPLPEEQRETEVQESEKSLDSPGPG